MKQAEAFYTFRHNSFHTRGFTWAWNIVPRSEMHFRECSECGTVEEYPSGAFDVVVEGGTKYPDILGCGAYPFLIVSEAVITAWHAANITCFHSYPVGIAEVKAKKLREVVPPLYFRVEIDGTCQIDLSASGVKLVSICPQCGHIIEDPSSYEHGYQMVPGSWDGCALFRDPIVYPRVSFCTGEVLRIAGQHRFSNFRFEPMEELYDPASKGIQYLSRKQRT
jgi:hypothetical protein